MIAVDHERNRRAVRNAALLEFKRMGIVPTEAELDRIETATNQKAFTNRINEVLRLRVLEAEAWL